MKRLFLIAALFLFATTRLIASFDFSSVSSSGHTLYYRILNQDLHTVYVTYPGSSSNPYNNYIEPSGNLVIPSSVAYDGYTYTVVMIGEYAFSGCDNLLSVVIPSTVTEFGNRSAFSNCESLVSVNIPSGVRTISPYTFSGCYSLPSIQLPDTLRVISDYAFNGCSALTSITFPNTLRNINNYAFAGCSGLTTLSLPSSLLTIGSYAFLNCTGLTGVLEIPESLISAGNCAFSGCSNISTVRFNALNCTTFGSSSYNAFAGCSHLTHVEFGNGVRCIPAYMFSNCSMLLQTPTFPSSLETIGSYAFYNCYRMQGQLSFSGTQLYNIGSNAFYNCPLMTGHITIPEGVTTVQENTFYGCAGLSGVSFSSTVNTIITNSFANCTGLVDTLVIPQQITRLDGNVFLNCTGLTAVKYNAVNSTTGNSTTMGYYWNFSPFQGCTSLRHIEIGNQVRSIPACLFYCRTTSNISNVPTFPSSLETIGDYAFYNCYLMQGQLILPDSVISIGEYAFQGCSKLTGLEIGSMLQNIYSSSFYDCSSIAMIRSYAITPPTIYTNAFYNVPTNIPVFVPCGYGPQYAQANGWSNFSWIIASSPYTFDVTTSHTEHGSVTVSQYPSCTNSSASFTAVPARGYLFSHWSDFNTQNPRTMSITQNTVLRAFFQVQSFALTANSSNINYGTVVGGGMYDYSTWVTIEAVPQNHYHFLYWNDGVINNPRYVQVLDNVSYTAFFAPDTHNITVASSDAQQGNVTGGGNFAYGTNSVLTATANNHYHFVQWSDGSTDNPHTITVTNDATYTAQFAPDNYTISVSATDNSMGSVYGGGTYAYNTTALLTATPIAHYHFVKWMDDNTENPRLVTVTENISFIAQFAPNLYTISVLTSDNVMGTVYGNGNFTYNDTVTITALANNHYHFEQWSDGSTVNPRTVTVTGDATYTAQFLPDNYTVTASSADNTMGYVTGEGSYAYNTTALLTATPNAHYHFVQWLDGNTDNPRLVTVTDNTSFMAQFAPDIYVILASSADNDMGSVSGSGNYAYNSTATLTAIPNQHYHFTQWTDNNIANPRTITVSGDSAFTAQFALNNYSVTVLSADYTMGTTLGSGNYTYNTSAILTAQANDHYHFTQWSDGSTVNPRTITVTGDVTYTAMYAPDNYMITVSSADISMGVVSGGGNYAYNTSATLTATANNHYHFAQWSDGNTVNPRTIIVSGDSSFTALFAPDNYTVTVISANNNMGTVSGGGSYTFNTTATLSATANSLYHFTQWTDGVVDNPRTITVVSDSVFTAQFAPNNFTVTVVSSDNNMGTVSGGGSYTYNTMAVLIAIANPHYHFTQWSDGNTENPRVITVTDNISYIAQFAPDNYTITVTSSDNSMGSVFGGGSYPYNSTATLVAMANTHYHFAQWSDGSTDNPHTVTVDGNASYLAMFAPNNYTVTVNSTDSAMGVASGGGSYAYNSTISLTATATPHYHFTQWTDGNTENPRIITVTGNVTYTAMFAEDSLFCITVLSDNIEMGSVSGGDNYYQGDQALLVASPLEHYVFSHWNDGSTENPRTITVTGNATYTAYFSGMMYYVSVSSTDPNAGYVRGEGYYEYGTQATVTAIPYDGHAFVEWSDGSEENPYTFTVVDDISLSANFTGVGIADYNNNSITIRVNGHHIEIDGAEGLPVVLYDLTGKVVSTSTNANNGLYVHATGLYLLRIGKHGVYKIFIQE